MCVSSEETDPAEAVEREIREAVERLRHQRGELYEIEHPTADRATESGDPAEPSSPEVGPDPSLEPGTTM
jgi:hypothetical protein